MARTAPLKELVARTDNAFRFENGLWIGPCLFCGRRLVLNPVTGEGASLEHIRPRSDGGTNEPTNLALAHARCNGEKGRRTDSTRARRRDPERYERIVAQLLARRAQRFRPPVDSA